MHVESLEKEKQRYKHKVQAQKDGKKNMITASCSQNDRLKTDSDGGGCQAFGSVAFDLLNK
jgi:hypothetical protein